MDGPILPYSILEPDVHGYFNRILTTVKIGGDKLFNERGQGLIYRAQSRSTGRFINGLKERSQARRCRGNFNQND